MKDQYIIYVRKSTDDPGRQVRSIGDQLAELRELARKEGLDVIAELQESQTAKQPGRPVFNAMLDRVEAGEATGILAWHPDRLARNWLDAARVIHMLDAGQLRRLRFPTVPFDPTASGKFLLGILFGQSKYYVDSLGENIRRGQRQKVRNGIWPMVPAVGYVNDPRTRGIVPDPARAPLVRRAYELYASGTYTLDRLAATMTDVGFTARTGRPLSRPQYHRMLSNPIYRGIIDYGGEVHEGLHQPLVTTVLFERVKEVMGRRSKPRAPRLKPYLYRGLFRCATCGCTVTTETQKGHNYLRCTKRVDRSCPQPYVREEVVVQQVTDLLADVGLTAGDAARIIGSYEAEREAARHSTVTRNERVRGQIAEVDVRLDRLLSLYLDESLSLGEYHDRKAELLNEKQVLKEHLRASEDLTTGGWFEPAMRFIAGLQLAAELASNGSDEAKRDFLRKTGSNLFIDDRRLTVDPRGAWKTVVAQGRWGRGGGGGVASARPADPGFAASVRWRRIRDVVRTAVKDNAASDGAALPLPAPLPTRAGVGVVRHGRTGPRLRSRRIASHPD